MSTASSTTQAAVPPLTRPEMGLAGIGALAAAGVGALGLLSSYDSVSEAAASWGFESPWMLPVGIDLAIPVFTVANLLLIRMDMALGWVRFVPWVLTAVTCWLNVAAGHGWVAKLAHGVMPLLWVVFSEIGAHIYAVRIGVATGRRMEKVRFSRWLLAPLSTFGLWRRMTLWEITSYPEALRRERERQLARAELRERHGRRWRSQTPRTERVLLKLGELAPAAEEVVTPPAAEEQPAEAPGPKQDRKPKDSRKSKKPPTRSLEELLVEARELTTDWADSDVNGEALRKGLRCSSESARRVRDALLAERKARRPHSVSTEPEAVAA
ncbi:DUF2637 domain-containing protein [Streptomyces indicus]|uniref:DUF2637 domain-containing protein n=1 Tax=Streptomyces indicus TaxID=417292 RepID=A0A1G9EUA7_9ACTN|nr:DUF2637 domain-containing protein [Streptomyces indicus]SDK79585.1 Protein of unknown function [Streptomyces indicus]